MNRNDAKNAKKSPSETRSTAEEHVPSSCCPGFLMAFLFAAAGAWAADPWADFMHQYDPGANVTPGYTDPTMALGHPSTTTEDSSIWPPDPTAPPVAVRMTDSAWTPSDVVAIGKGGFLTVGFNEPVLNHPGNPFGIDLIVFGNASFGTTDWPINKQITDPATIWEEPGKIEVSVDGVTFYAIRRDLVQPGKANVFADALFPTHAYASDDAHPPQGTPLQDFTKPVNPDLTLADFDGTTVSEALALYEGSAGGTPVDLSWAVDANGQPVALGQVSFVRVWGTSTTGVDIDGFADVAAVPEPASALLCLLGLGLLAVRRYASE